MFTAKRACDTIVWCITFMALQAYCGAAAQEIPEMERKRAVVGDEQPFIVTALQKYTPLNERERLLCAEYVGRAEYVGFWNSKNRFISQHGIRDIAVVGNRIVCLRGDGKKLMLFDKCTLQLRQEKRTDAYALAAIDNRRFVLSKINELAIVDVRDLTKEELLYDGPRIGDLKAVSLTHNRLAAYDTHNLMVWDLIPKPGHKQSTLLYMRNFYPLHSVVEASEDTLAVANYGDIDIIVTENGATLRTLQLPNRESAYFNRPVGSALRLIKLDDKLILATYYIEQSKNYLLGVWNTATSHYSPPRHLDYISWPFSDRLTSPLPRVVAYNFYDDGDTDGDDANAYGHHLCMWEGYVSGSK